ncbi:nuclear cap-binding protein subunit 1-like isoform X2 [Artemia franciscana]
MAGHMRKRRRGHEQADIEDRLESLIKRVGEKSSSSLESNLEGLTSVLEADLSTYKNKILRILTDCAVLMPDKCSVYSTLVGLLNAKNYNFGGELVESMAKHLKDYLKNCEWEKARYSVRFLSDLVNCHVVSAGSLIQLYDTMMEAALEPNTPQVRRDWFVYAILSALPWVGRELFEKKERDLDRLKETIDSYISRRVKDHLVSLRVWTGQTLHPQEEYLECLWFQICKLRNDYWQEKHIVRPYLAFDTLLSEALQHSLPPLNPPRHTESMVYPMPKVIFRMFDYTDCPELGPVLPGAHSIERYLIEEHLSQILDQNIPERKECAAALLAFPQKSKVPLEYMIIEVILGELFRLPTPQYLEIAYGSLMIELCKSQPSTIPQVLAQAVEILFDRIDTMNPSSFDRFANWFSYHLSNFQFKWSWYDWTPCLEMEQDHPKPRFVQEVLEKCLRLSYYQRVVDIVPKEKNFEKLLPPKPEPRYKYTEDNNNVDPVVVIAAQNLIASVKRKTTPEEAFLTLRDLPNPLQEEGEPDAPYNPLKIDVLVQTLLYLGAKSFTHAFQALAKYHQILKALGSYEEAQICILRSVYEIWHDHPQMMTVLVDKMLRTEIVECSAVANWLFSRDMMQDLTRMYIWEILDMTIRKMSKRVAKLERELAESKEKLKAAATSDGSSDSEAEYGRGRKRKHGVDMPSEKPTEEMIERMEDKVEHAQTDQKNLFLIIFQRFIMILSEYIVRCDTDGKDFKTHWYRWTLGRLQQVFLTHNEQVHRYSDTLETLLFTSDVDSHISETFKQFLALRS